LLQLTSSFVHLGPIRHGGGKADKDEEKAGGARDAWGEGVRLDSFIIAVLCLKNRFAHACLNF
jgi:hypothetical protein